MLTHVSRRFRLFILLAGHIIIVLGTPSSPLAEPSAKTCIDYIEADVIYEASHEKALAKMEAEQRALHSAYQRSLAEAQRAFDTEIERAKKSRKEATDNAVSVYRSTLTQVDAAYEAAMRQPRSAYQSEQRRVAAAYNNWLRVRKTIAPLEQKLFLAKRSKRDEIRRRIRTAKSEERRLSNIRYAISDAASKALENADKHAKHIRNSARSEAKAARDARFVDADATLNKVKMAHNSKIANVKAQYLKAKERSEAAKMESWDDLRRARVKAYQDAYEGPESNNETVMQRLIEGQRLRCAKLYEGAR